MPALLTRIRPAEIGWSKPHRDDLVEKLFETTFPAFKFPDRERLHLTCGVALCRGKCPNVGSYIFNLAHVLVIYCTLLYLFIFQVDCDREEFNEIPTGKLLIRLEVYNSLGVRAPQIDDLHSEKRFNVTGELFGQFLTVAHRLRGAIG